VATSTSVTSPRYPLEAVPPKDTGVPVPVPSSVTGVHHRIPATRGAGVLDITLSEVGGHIVCRPVGELDAFTVPQFREALATVGPAQRLLIDLGEVPFMDSAGLGALIGGIRRIREVDGEVVVACSRPTLMRLLHTTGFDRIVPVTETIDDAVEAFTDPDR